MYRFGLLVIFCSTVSYAQVKPLKTISLENSVKQVYVDRPGDLYIEFSSGLIKKYDSNGKLIQEFNPLEKLALFEPRDGARAFYYSQKSRWYSYSFFGNLNKVQLKPEFAIDPVLACSSGDKNIWVFDRADYSLKKINTTIPSVETEFRLPQQLQSAKADNIMIREYYGFLFLLDRTSGIYIFNAIGILLKTIEGSDIPYFNFLGEELYYPQKNKLIFYDLFDTKTREIELDPKVNYILLTDQRKYTIYNDRAEITLVSQ